MINIKKAERKFVVPYAIIPSSIVWRSRSLCCLLFRRRLYSHASIAVAFSDLIIMNMLIAGTQGP